MANELPACDAPDGMEDDRARDFHFSRGRRAFGPANGPGLQWSRPPLTVLISPLFLCDAGAGAVSGSSQSKQR